jgi:hypothetical protein
LRADLIGEGAALVFKDVGDNHEAAAEGHAQDVDLAGLAIGLAARQPAEGFADSAAGREALILACGGLRTASMQTHRGFSGISFWNDHETARHFRRIHSDLVRLGGSARARRDQADATQAVGSPEAAAAAGDLGTFAEEVLRFELRETVLIP